MRNRDTGIDIFRILCCIGVLVYHIVDDVIGQSGGAKLIYFAASFCVPGFFLMAGYLLSRKEQLTVEYIEHKVLGTMSKFIFWVIFWVELHFIHTGEMLSVCENVADGATSGGILPVAWFLFTYCLLIILGYPLWYFLKKNRYVFCIMAIVWIILLACDIGRKNLESKPQSLWLHLYIGYFILGMSLPVILNFLNKNISRKVKLAIMVIICIMSLCVYIWNVKTADVYMAPHNYYGKWYYSIWLTSFYMICLEINIKNVYMVELLRKLAVNTFTVYLGHLPLLLYMTSISPLKTTSIAVMYVMLFFIGLEIIAELFKKLPLLRKLV